MRLLVLLKKHIVPKKEQALPRRIRDLYADENLDLTGLNWLIEAEMFKLHGKLVATERGHYYAY